MSRILDAAGRSLKWVQPSPLRMHYELRSGEESVGILRFRSMWGSFATGECSDGCWTFKRVGFLQTRVTVRRCGADTEIASFVNNTWSGGGTLELPDGRKFPATTNFWQTRFEFRDESGGLLVQFDTAGFLHQSTGVTVYPAAVALPEVPWIVILGCYLSVMMRMDAVTASGGTSAT